MRALVVDDNAQVALFIAEALRQVEGMEADLAHTVEEAEQAAEKTAYDLFIVDVYLRGPDSSPDGLRLVKRLKAQKPGLKAILITGRSFSRILTDVVFRAGTTDLLGKPVDLKVLLETVRKVLARPTA
ncbi:MAG: response regulator [Planctomycetes bacterium]|jgi:DNA-binding response OmpR family regulator|nr:response regulator [Planctomycetota bacterium]